MFGPSDLNNVLKLNISDALGTNVYPTITGIYLDVIMWIEEPDEDDVPYLRDLRPYWCLTPTTSPDIDDPLPPDQASPFSHPNQGDIMAIGILEPFFVTIGAKGFWYPAFWKLRQPLDVRAQRRFEEDKFVSLWLTTEVVDPVGNIPDDQSWTSYLQIQASTVFLEA